MKRVTHVMCMSVFLMFTFAQVASADAACELSVEGGLTDVFGNAVWGGSQVVDVGVQPDAGACSTRASFALNNFAYSICAQRSSGVNLNIPGDVYFGGQWVQQHSGPASCVSGFGLNSYTPLGSGAVLNPGNSIASPNGWYILIYQTDGNIVVNQGSTVVWAGNCWPTCNNWGFAGAATITASGNFVVTNSNNDAVWMSATASSGAFLALRDDGEIVVYATNGNWLWSSVYGHS